MFSAKGYVECTASYHSKQQTYLADAKEPDIYIKSCWRTVQNKAKSRV